MDGRYFGLLSVSFPVAFGHMVGDKFCQIYYPPRKRARITHEIVTMTATITKEGMCDVNGNFS